MEARFPSYCEECEHPIRAGDEIMPTEDGDWTHAECVPYPSCSVMAGCARRAG